MKTALVFGGLIALFVAFQVGSALTPTIIKRCINSTQVPAVDLALFYGTDYIIVSLPVKCYVACTFESAGFITGGVINDDLLIMTKNPREAARFRTLMDICSNPDIEGECEANYQAVQCWLTQGKVRPKQADKQMKIV